MELSTLSVRDFSALLGSDAPAPGGGSAAALCGALGAALSAMVSALTVGSVKFEEFHNSAKRQLLKADTLRQEMLTAMEEDTAAFNQVSAAFALPKATEEEKAARSQAIQAALCLKAGLQGAWLNVLINVGSLKDKELAEAYRIRGESLLSQGITLADEIYEQVEESL